MSARGASEPPVQVAVEAVLSSVRTVDRVGVLDLEPVRDRDREGRHGSVPFGPENRKFWEPPLAT